MNLVGHPRAPVLWLLLLSILPAVPLSAESIDVRMIIAGKDTGGMIVERDGDHIEIDFDYKQNGRGPTIVEEIDLDADGLPVRWQISGRTTFGNAVDERYRYAGGTAEWQDATGTGSASLASNSFYVDQNGSFYSLALLARALLADDDGAMEVLPGGSVRIEDRGSLTLKGADGPTRVTTYEIFGLSMAPANVTLDEDGEFFATASPRFVAVRAGYEAQADEILRAQAERLSTQRFPGSL